MYWSRDGLLALWGLTGTHAAKRNIMDTLSSALFDLYDVRAALTRQEKQRPKDGDGSSITIGDCLDDAISFLESLETA